MAVTLGSTGITFPDSTTQTTAASASPLVLIGSTVASSSASVSFPMSSTYKAFLLVFSGVNSGATNGSIKWQGSDDSGSSYYSTGYNWGYFGYENVVTAQGTSNNSQNGGYIMLGSAMNTGSGRGGCHGEAWIFPGDGTSNSYPYSISYGIGWSTNYNAPMVFSGEYMAAAKTFNYVKFSSPDNGSNISGRFTFFGMKTS